MAAAAQVDWKTGRPRIGRFEPEFELLVACCDNTKKSDLTPLLAPDLDWDRVLKSAEHHRLLPALFEAFTSQNQSLAELRERARNHAWRSLQFTAELKKIARCFKQHGIPFLAHKGPALAQVLYGDPARRQFGDLDLLVKPADVPQARTALVELGYEPGLRLSPVQENSYLHSGYEYVFGLNSEPNLVELQWQIVPRFCAIKFEMQALFERSIEIEVDGARIRTLGYEDQMLVLSVHAAKHEWAQLGMLRDIVTLARFDLDWTWIVTEACRLGIFKILQVSLLVVRELFFRELPEAVESMPVVRGAAKLAHTVVTKLQSNYGPDTESLLYFRAQLQTRERWRDRTQFAWRLATTPGVQEWKAIRMPDRFFALYRGLRIARLIRRLVKG
ncbi:MAG: hypothetical protein JWN74_249 [Acidobacteriaceae bacterium]|nr:hypothetical protein [Acidobacteriaceae bacterium]